MSQNTVFPPSKNPCAEVEIERLDHWNHLESGGVFFLYAESYLRKMEEACKKIDEELEKSKKKAKKFMDKIADRVRSR